MNERLFSLDSIPEVPLFRKPRRSRGEYDARFRNDYPPEWTLCPDCLGRGWFPERDDGSADRRGVCLSDRERLSVDEVYAPGWHRQACDRCLGMGSMKARVRLEAGHRCVRCLHPYVPKGDAKMLGVEPTPYHWSPCDERCAHCAPTDGPVRMRTIDGLVETQYVGTDGMTYLAGDVRSSLLPEFVAVEAEWRILTVHHLDGDKANCRWWNLAALCQRCHLEIQAKVVMERVYPHEHSEWFKPYVAGYYAHVYLGEDLSRESVEARMPELLDLERMA